ncbi:DUF2971 domain-containing protein [Neobacillus niacini]|uniref:DUF2971 domain-containing protein n=1 Tax=Neobacillus niacini TaxID=86668 RepID=UPI00285A8A70|nr:DUF2971 domain-containing protein [Neobacillus niacini]MDR7000995.1 hypothetical protein [Neobacillus niacini]
MNHGTNDEMIYHFTSLSTAIEHILYNGTLRLSPFTGTNDPKENKDWIPTLALTGDIRHLQIEEIKSIFNEKKAGASLICFSEDRVPPPLSSLGMNAHMAPFRDKYYKGYYRPRMWAQYADNHKGFCLGFNKERLIREARRLFEPSGRIIEGSVSYSEYNSEQYSAFTLDLKAFQLDREKYIQQHQEKYLKYLFFEKAIDWKDESEFRVLYLPNVPKEQKSPHYIDIEGCIETIIVGYEFPEVYIPSLLSLKKYKYPNAKLNQLKYHNGQPVLTSLLRNNGFPDVKATALL